MSLLRNSYAFTKQSRRVHLETLFLGCFSKNKYFCRRYVTRGLGKADSCAGVR